MWATRNVVHISTGSPRERPASASGRDRNLPDFLGRRGADLNRQVESAPCPTPCSARMPGQYLTRCRVRPRPASCERHEAEAARLFLCGRCRRQVLVCSGCDRGQIYCAGTCAQEARRGAQRAASKRYQASRRGRINHAARARRYRARQKNVTHQSSQPRSSDDLLSSGSMATARGPNPSNDVPSQSTWRCHWCGCRCSLFVRQGFLRRRRIAQTVQHRRGSDRDDFP